MKSGRTQQLHDQNDIYITFSKISILSYNFYVGNDKVLHFTRGGQEVGTGTVLDLLLVISAPTRSNLPCDCKPMRYVKTGIHCIRMSSKELSDGSKVLEIYG